MAQGAALAFTDRAEQVSHALPPLLVEAHRIAETVILGIHGRKRSGPGETFWQYRPYSFGDSTQRIDWHKSARSERVFIRENEWEAANTLWVWAAPFASMRFKSHLSSATKHERAQLVGLAAAWLAVRAHERIGALGSPYAPGYARATLVRIAQWMLDQDPQSSLSRAIRLPRFSTVLMLSDFLERPETIAQSVSALAASGVAGHLVQVVDPAEETLPYTGRVEFYEMAGPAKFLAGKAETLRDSYQARFTAQREAVREIARRVGWTFTIHRTDSSPVALLLSIHTMIAGEKSRIHLRGAA